MPDPSVRDQSAELLLRASGTISTAAMARMESDKSWFRELSADDKSWVGSIVQAGIRGFVDWFHDHPDASVPVNETDTPIAAQVFGVAPRALTGVVSLQQTVELVRLTIDVVEASLDDLLGADLAPAVHEALLLYGRELAFATAEVYARAAEARGAWDARLEALVVDAVLRADTDDPSLLSRASALGWDGSGAVLVLLGSTPDGRQVDVFDEVRRTARAASMDALCAVQGDRMVVVLGRVDEPARAAATVTEHFADGPVVYGPPVPDLARAHVSARAAIATIRVAHAWPEAPRPVSADELLPERILDGDTEARDQLLAEVYDVLREARGTLIETLDAYFSHGGSVEGTARALFVHPNTVRYRLRQATDLTGLAPTQARHAHTYAIALTLGRLRTGE